MDENGILMSYLMLELADGLQKRLALDIANGSAYLNDGNLGVGGGVVAVEAALDLVGDVGDHLNCASAKVAAALFLEYAPVNLTGGDVGILGQALVNETLIVAKIQIGLGTVVGDEYLAVLNRVHGTRVNVDVGVKFLHGYFVTARF